MKASYKISLVIAAALLLFVILFYTTRSGDTPASKRLADAANSATPTGGDRGSVDDVSANDGSSGREARPGAGGSARDSRNRSKRGVAPKPKPDNDTLAFLRSRIDHARTPPKSNSTSSQGGGDAGNGGSSSEGSAQNGANTSSMPRNLPAPDPSDDPDNGRSTDMFPGFSGGETAVTNRGGSGNARSTPPPSDSGTGSQRYATTQRRAPTGTPRVDPGDSSADANADADQPQTYTIQPRDTFSTLAQEHYGSARDWKLIAQANPLVDPNHLKVGQEIRLPPKPEATEGSGHSGSASRSSSISESAGGETASDTATRYTVKAGDTLSSIAREYYGNPAKWKSIYDANRRDIGSNPAAIKAGMTLTIPPPPEAAR